MEPPNDIEDRRRRALFIVNRKSRAGGGALDDARSVLSREGIDLIERTCPSAAALSPLIEAEGGVDEAEGGVDMVIIGGGDGTFNAALEGLVRIGRPLGILPLGTGNDFARTLGIPINLAEAARVIAAGTTHRIDLGLVNDKYFMNVASVGLSTWLAAELTRDIKRRWGRFGYALGALRAWRRARPFMAHIVCDGENLSLPALMVAVGNGRHFGGGMVVAEDARIDDARLDLFALAPCHLLRFVRLLPWLRKGRHGELVEIRTIAGRAITLDTIPVLPINTDGEITTATPARFSVRPQALTVFVPALTPGPTE